MGGWHGARGTDMKGFEEIDMGSVRKLTWDLQGD